MTGLDAKCFDFIKMFIISCTKCQQILVHCLKFLEFTESAFFGRKTIPSKFLNTVVLDSMLVSIEKNR